MDLTTHRVRTVTWADRLEFATAAELSGLEFLQAMARGEIPSAPMMDLIGMRLISAREGETVFRLLPGEFHYNPMWTVHGGVYATMLDSAAACAVHTTLPAGARFSTLDLSVRLLKAIRADTGEITATGRVVHESRNFALAEARLEDSTGKLLATATAGCSVVRPRLPATGETGV
ncbi:PaaI family thioesterase [Amycolatopsis sp. NPDC051061]|uniref:PaaI family thioesterase n=1 Tax=Amycolatopsis sp. NPDC051061 TaxID=3155042 RepID=UPI0034192005